MMGPMNDTATPGAVAVVGVDGSSNSRAALDWALDHVHRQGGGVVRVVMSWSYPPMAAAGYPLGGGLPPAEAMSEATDAALADMVADLDVPDDVVVEPVVREGAAASAVLAEAEGADIVVVGKRGHGGFLGLLLGSVATQVANHAPCPVVIVPG